MGQQLLSDLWQIWSTDLQASNTGDLQTATGTDRGQQRIIRRLMTNPGDYIEDPTYGAGLPQYVGAPQSKDTLDKIAGTCTAQILVEAVVAPTPAPVVTLQQQPDFSLWVSVQYTDAETGEPQTLSFNAAND
jgi:phage baseplate assembly protein W